MRIEKHTYVTGPSMSGSGLSMDFPALKHGAPLPRIPKIDHLYSTQESPQPPNNDIILMAAATEVQCGCQLH